MKIGRHSIHAQYNDENRLWAICQKIDLCILGKRLHENHLSITPNTTPTQVENRGLIRIHLTPDMLTAGGTLLCSATTEEAGESLSLVSPQTLRRYGMLTPQVTVLPAPVKNELPIGINCEYENLLAHEKASKGLKNKNAKDASALSVAAKDDLANTPSTSAKESVQAEEYSLESDTTGTSEKVAALPKDS